VQAEAIETTHGPTESHFILQVPQQPAQLPAATAPAAPVEKETVVLRKRENHSLPKFKEESVDCGLRPNSYHDTTAHSIAVLAASADLGETIARRLDYPVNRG
jgi:hypothetical protein